MEERVKELLERVRQAAETVGDVAGSTARYAGRCAGGLVDLTKLNLQIFDLNTEIGELLRSAGQTVYQAHLGEDTDEGALAALLESLDVKNAQVLELRERIAAMKSTKPCPACGAPCSREDRFCRACGASL